MKTFAQLTIGDVIYKVWTNYQSQEKPMWEKIVVKNIKREEVRDVDSLLINEYRGYSNTSYLISLPFSSANVTEIENKEGFFTTDYNCVCEGIKNTGLSHIRAYETEIENLKKKIQGVRKEYYEYLNFVAKEPIAV